MSESAGGGNPAVDGPAADADDPGSGAHPGATPEGAGLGGPERSVPGGAGVPEADSEPGTDADPTSTHTSTPTSTPTPAPGSRFGGLRAAVVAAWRVRTVRQGFLGTLLITLGSVTPGYLPTNSPFWGPLRRLHLAGTPVTVAGTILTVVGIGVLVDAWFRLRPAAGNGRSVVAYRDLRHWAVLGIWALPFLVAPPILSQDAYSYAATGWLLHNHINPYLAGPGTLPGAFADQVSWVWRFTPCPYGPLSIRIAQFLDWIAGYRPYLAACLFRIPALVGVALIGHFVPRIAVQMRLNPAPVAWFAVLNPILVVDFIGGMHNDSLMTGFVVFGLWLAGRSRQGSPAWWLLGCVMVGVAATIKQPALLAAYALPLIPHPLKSWRWREVAAFAGRELLSFVVTLATFAGVSLATGLDFGWRKAVSVPGSITTASPSTSVGYALQFVAQLLHLSQAPAMLGYAHTLGYVVAGALLAVLAVTVARRRPITFLSYGYLGVAFGLPALHTWYVLWGGVLFPLARPRYRTLRVAVWITVALLAYDAVSMAIRNGLYSLGIAGVLGYFWTLWQHHRNSEARVLRRRRASLQRQAGEQGPTPPDAG